MNRIFKGFICALALMVLAAPAALAVGTTAGTVISNQAYADLSDANGNTLARVYSNTVTTTVEQVAGVELTPDTSSRVGSPDQDAHILVEVWNRGNATDTFTIEVEEVAGGDWDHTGTVSLYQDSKTQGSRHVWDVGIDDQLLLTAPYSTTSAADRDDHVFIVIPIPNTAQDGDTVSVNLTATSQFDGSVTDLGTYTVTVAAASLDMVKQFSTGSPEPGETVTYTLTLTNDGTVHATNVVVTDEIRSNFTYVPGSITLDTVAQTDADDPGTDGSDYNITNPGEITVDVGTVSSGGGTAVITFQVTVDDGVPAGTGITNAADMAFKSGLNNLTGQSNTTLVYVDQIAGVDTAATGATSKSGDPGDQIAYQFSVSNDGNDTDVIDLTYNSTAGWDYEFWLDNDGDGVPGTDGDYLLTDTDGDNVIDTGSIDPGDTDTLLIVAVVPAGTSDGTVDNITITATSSFDTDVTDQQDFSTTVTAPVLALVKSVSPTGAQPPGTELTYTLEVTNSGSGVATEIIITDPVPQYTTYVTSSLYTGNSLGALTNRSDASDGDGGTYDSTNKRVVVGSGGNLSLGSGGAYYVQFKVTID